MGAARLRGMRVVVLDDHEDARLLVATVLEREGASVSLAGSAAEGLQLVREARPDLLLSDIGMAEVDGYELLRRVRELPPDGGGATPAVALTAYAGDGDRTTTVAAGFLRHIAKPIVPDTLVSEIESLWRAGLIERRTIPLPRGNQT
jgi:CheY-like chemotaxis protein